MVLNLIYYQKLKKMKQMSCYSREGVADYSSSGDIYPDIPDFSHLKVDDSKTPANVCRICYNKFMANGCSKSGALGICANIAAESGFKPDIITWDGNKKSGKFGIGGGLCGFYRFGALPMLAQHAKNPSMADIEKLDNAIRNCGRLPLPTTPTSAKNAKFIRENFCNFPYTLEQQLDYLVSIINGSYSGIKTQSSPSEAALWWCKKYERPAVVTDRWQTFGKTVTKYLQP